MTTTNMFLNFRGKWDSPPLLLLNKHFTDISIVIFQGYISTGESRWPYSPSAVNKASPLVEEDVI